MRLSPFNAYPEYEKNPFPLEGMGERWIEKEAIQSKFILIDPVTGEERPLFHPPRKITVPHDSLTYTKVFRKDVKELSAGAKLILMYMIYHIRPLGRDMEINMGTVTAWGKFSRATFYNALRELLDRDIVAIKERKKQTFFVNPNYVYNGNRTKMK